MNIFTQFRGFVIATLDALVAEGRLPPGLETAKVAVEPPREVSHGDLSTNAGMVLTRQAGM